MASTDKLIRIILQLKDEMSDQLNKASGSLDKIGGKMTKVGAGMTAAVTAPLVGIGAAAAKTAIEFESAFAGVEKTIDGSAEELGAIREELEALATSGDSPVAALENAQIQLFEIAEAAGQLGVSKENIVDFTEVMGELSMSTDIAGEEGARMVAQFANVAKMPLDEIRNFGDVISTLGNNLATTENEILRFGQRMGTLSQVGFKPEDILAYGGAMASMGINAELGSTNFVKGVNTMAAEIAKGGPSIEAVADKMGYTLEELADHFERDAAGAVLRFTDTLREMPIEEQIETLGLLSLNGTEAQRVFMSMANNTDLLTNSMDMATTAMQGNNALVDEAGKRAQTTAGQLNLLRNNLSQLANDIGVIILPVINKFVQVLIPVVQAFSNLPQPVQTVIVAFAALLAAVGPLLMVFGGIISAVSTISAAFAAGGALASIGTLFASIVPVITAFGAALAGLGAPVLIAIAAVAALWAAWKTNLFGIRDLVQNVFGQLPYQLQQTIKAILQPIASLKKALRLLFTGDFKGMAGFAEDSWITSAILKIREHLIGFLKFLTGEFLVKMAEAGVLIIKGLINGIMSMGAKLVDGVKGLASSVAGALRDAFKIRSPSKVMMKLGEQVGEGFNQGVQAMGGFGVSIPTASGTGSASTTPMMAGAGLGGGNVYINTISVPPGTTQEQAEAIMREIGKAAKRRGAKGIR